MKQGLLQFLREEEQVEYKPFKARIVGLEPFRLCEDNKEFLQVENFLTEGEVQKYQKSPANHAEAAIEDWRLEAANNPNTHERIIRLVADKYKLKKPTGKGKPKSQLTDLLDSESIK